MKPSQTVAQGRFQVGNLRLCRRTRHAFAPGWCQRWCQNLCRTGLRHWSTQADHPFDQYQPSANVQPCITVRHETSGCGEDFDHLHLARRSHPFTRARLLPMSLLSTRCTLNVHATPAMLATANSYLRRIFANGATAAAQPTCDEPPRRRYAAWHRTTDDQFPTSN